MAKILSADNLGGEPVDPVSPGASVPLQFDFAALTNGRGAVDWLNGGETIASYTLTVDAELAHNNDQRVESNTGVQFFVNPDSAITPGEYSAVCQVTTDSTPARTQSFTMIIPVYQK